MMVLVALKWARSTDLPAVDGRESLGIAMPTRWSACPSSTGRGSSLGSGKSVGCGAKLLLSCQERRPAELAVRVLHGQGFLDRQLSHGFYHPLEIFRADGIDIRVGSGIHEVDGVRNAAFNGELDRVQVIAKSAAERKRIFDDAVAQRGLRLGIAFDVAFVERRLRVIAHDVDFFLADHVAAEVFLELHAALQGHTQVAGFVVALKKFFRVVDLVNMFPPAAVVGLKECWEEIFSYVGFPAFLKPY